MDNRKKDARPIVAFQNLVIVIEEKNMEATIHQAYGRISINEEGNGVFIVGPSKTTDIEQSLVIGVHAPLSLHVYMLQQ